MYLPRDLISHLYTHLVQSQHPLSPPVLILVALETDALCACRILASLLKRDYVPHKIQPVSGYADLTRAAHELVKPMRTNEGGSGGVVVCLGVGGLVDLAEVLGLESEDPEEDALGGMEVWVFDSRRPWNLDNVFGGAPASLVQEERDNARREVTMRRKMTSLERGCLQKTYRPGKGGIVVYDDGDIEHELEAERNAYHELSTIPEIEEFSDDAESASENEDSVRRTKKRKSWSDRENEESGSDEEEFEGPPRQRRRSNSVGWS